MEYIDAALSNDYIEELHIYCHLLFEMYDCDA
jgi:hypothetical protein